MDPNANLEELLSLAEQHADSTDMLDVDDYARMAELVLALDGWIKGGGFLPRVWKEAQR